MTRGRSFFVCATVALCALTVACGARDGDRTRIETTVVEPTSHDYDADGEGVVHRDAGTKAAGGVVRYSRPVHIASHPYVGWVVGETIIWKDTRGVWTREYPPVELGYYYRVYDVAAIDEEHAVAVGRRSNPSAPLILKRDEHGWRRVAPPASDCRSLSQVEFAGPDDGFAICGEAPTNSTTYGFRYRNGTWSLVRNPVAPWIWIEDAQATGPHEYLVSGYNSQEWSCVPFKITDHGIEWIPMPRDGWGGACILHEGSAGRFGFILGTREFYSMYVQFDGPDWIDAGWIEDALVTRWGLAPGGNAYAIAFMEPEEDGLLFDNTLGFWYRTTNWSDPSVLDGVFWDVDSRADDHVVVVGRGSDDLNITTKVVRFDGSHWFEVSPPSGVIHEIYKGVSYAPDPNRWDE